jgi:hypothetical protein
MSAGTAILIIFGICGMVAMLFTAAGRAILLLAVVVIGGLGYYMKQKSDADTADFRITNADQQRICGTDYQFAIHEPTTEACWTAFTAANVNRYATDQCGGEYTVPHKKGYEACVARAYLTVCGRDGVSYINPYHCAALETRMAQFKE